MVRSHTGKHHRPLPTTVIPALEGIIVELGYQCQLCNAAYHTDNSMKTHLRKKHDIDEQLKWRRKKLPLGPMQSFSTSNTVGGRAWRSPCFQVFVTNPETKVHRKAAEPKRQGPNRRKNVARGVLDGEGKSQLDLAAVSTNDLTTY
jgi:hypothetical protein